MLPLVDSCTIKLRHFSKCAYAAPHSLWQKCKDHCPLYTLPMYTDIDCFSLAVGIGGIFTWRFLLQVLNLEMPFFVCGHNWTDFLNSIWLILWQKLSFSHSWQQIVCLISNSLWTLPKGRKFQKNWTMFTTIRVTEQHESHNCINMFVRKSKLNLAHSSEMCQ